MSFATVRAGGLEFFRAAELQVPNAFTTRRGGVSEGCLSELNLGFHRGDRPRNVLENHRRLAAAVGYDVKRLVCTRQVHGDAVRVVTEADWGQGLFWPAPDCDGLVTQTPGTALAVFVADCTPVLLWDAATGAVGAVHAGWRGTALGIAARAVETMARAFGTRPQDVRAAIGPCVGRCCYETGPDVPAAMADALGPAARSALDDLGGGRWRVDLKELNAVWLARAGVGEIVTAPWCTACQPERFFSHRRMGEARGLQAAVIACGPRR